MVRLKASQEASIALKVVDNLKMSASKGAHKHANHRTELRVIPTDCERG